MDLFTVHSRCLFISLLIMWMFYFNFHKQTFALDNIKKPLSIMKAHSTTTEHCECPSILAKRPERHILFKQRNKGWKGSGHWKFYCLSFKGLWSLGYETEIRSDRDRGRWLCHLTRLGDLSDLVRNPEWVVNNAHLPLAPKKVFKQ